MLSVCQDAVQNLKAALRYLKLQGAHTQVAAEAEEDLPFRPADCVGCEVRIPAEVSEIRGGRGRCKFGALQQLVMGEHEHLTRLALPRQGRSGR